MHPAKRRLACLALLALAVGGAATAEPAATQSAAAGALLPSTWLADARTGCKVWNPQPEPGERVEWSGACKDGFASGPGVVQWLEDGVVTERTEGNRAGGHLQGRGVQVSASGDRFEGSWKDDSKDGPGAYTASDGTRYVGDFKADRFDGYGVLTDSRGNRYEGAWRNGRRNGQGTFTGADGSSFTGLWIDDQPVGRGTPL